MAATRRSYEAFHNKPRAVLIPFWVFRLILTAIILLALAIVAFVMPRGPALDRGNAALVKAFSNRRLIEPRLAGGFKAANFNPAKDDKTGINKSALEDATDLIQDALSGDDPNAHLAYGRLLLCNGIKTRDALKHLRLAVKGMPGSPEPHNDLGACLFDSGKLEDALDEFNLALECKADMPEALFNRALCYERLLLRETAGQDYTRLMAIDRDRDWLKEAKRRQEQVSAPLAPQEQEDDIVAAFDSALEKNEIEEVNRIADQNVEVVIKHVSRQCVDEYLKESVAGNNEKAERALSEIELIGRHLVEARGDTSITDLATYLRNLPAEERPTELGLISDFNQAEKLLSIKNYSDAQKSFERLSSQFAARGNDIFQDCSTLILASCLYSSGQFLSSIENLNKTLAFDGKHMWPSRRALGLSQLAIGHSRLGHDSLAIKYCEQALQLGGDMHWIEATALQYLSTAYGNLGDLDNQLACLRRSVNLYLASIPSLKYVADNYLNIAQVYSFRGNHSLALLYAKAALRTSDQANDNNRAAQASSLSAVEYAKTNQVAQAEESLSQAFEYLQKIKKGSSRFTEALILKRSGEMAAQLGDVARAVEYFSKAEALVELFEDKTIPMIRVLRERAEAYTKAKEFDKARLDLELAISEIEDYSSSITERKNRCDFQDAIQGVFDAMVLLNGRSFNNWPEAFNLSEQSRARALLRDLASTRSASVQGGGASSQEKSDGSLPGKNLVSSLTLPKVQAALPDDLRLVTYSVTNQGTFIFLVTRSGFETAESPATTENLDQLVLDYVSGLKSIAPLDELSEKARSLYRYLIKPIAGRLSDGKRLCIVPDKALHFLPFAALVDESDRYLIESYRMTYAPSASVLVQCLEEARNKGASKYEKILAVGNPLFNQERFPALKELQDAEQEAKMSAAFYEERNILNREDATEAKVHDGLMDCEIAHLSLHCLVEEKSPWLAALVLADQTPGASAQSPSDDSLLYLGDIYGMILPRIRLVVLSACQSGLGQYYRGEGIVSLVRPFLAVRVPTVVASLWSVDSHATASLMIDFHRERKTKNLGAGDALRAAQVKMARDDSYRHPYFWAPFIAVGSNN